MKLSHLTDAALLKDTKDLAQRERSLTTQVLWHIREVDRRKLYADLKYPSVWYYLVKELGYSEASATRRLNAARALQEMPELEAKIESGALNLTNLNLVLTQFKDESTATKREVIKEIENKQHQEVKAIIQEKTQRPAQKFKIEVDEETYKLILELKSLKTHDKDPVKTAIKASIQEAKKQKFKEAARPKVESKARLKRDVFTRDNHQCRNCGSKHGLEIDHIKPKALGGTDDAQNLRVLCRNCNQRARLQANLTRRTSTCGGQCSGSTPPRAFLP